MNHKQYEQAMEEARGDADAMLGASLLRIWALERVLAELVDTTNAMSPVDHRAFQKACDLLPPKQDGKEASDPSDSRPLSWCGNEGEYDPEALGSDAWLTGCPRCGANCWEDSPPTQTTERQTVEEFNPRYVAYARAHGKTPEEMIEYDHVAWPGGCMCGFMIWMSVKKQAFFKTCRSAFLDRYAICDQDKWTAFLVDMGEKEGEALKHLGKEKR